MKTRDQIISSKPVLLNSWEGRKPFDIFHEFYDSDYSKTQVEIAREIKKLHLGEKILFASYNSEGYESYAFVLFSKNGRLFEINASHCSCYGLEGQWNPETVNLKALRTRVKKGTFADYLYCKEELSKFLGINENRSSKV